MKQYKSFNQQLSILKQRGIVVSNNTKAKEFLEQENYYNVINGYKELFLDRNNNLPTESYLTGTKFDEIKSLFLMDRELRLLFLRYLLILESSFKTVYAHEFSKKHRKPNSYLDIQNYTRDDPKKVLQQISILANTIKEKIDKEGAIKHYVEEHDSVPLWVLVNYLTIGNISNLYSVLNPLDQETIATVFSKRHKREYKKEKSLHLTPFDIMSALKAVNLIRNVCAHEERLYNFRFQKNVAVSNVAKHYGYFVPDNKKIIVLILYLKVLLNKETFGGFYAGLKNIFDKYRPQFSTIAFDEILNIMGIDEEELKKII